MEGGEGEPTGLGPTRGASHKGRIEAALREIPPEASIARVTLECVEGRGDLK